MPELKIQRHPVYGIRATLGAVDYSALVAEALRELVEKERLKTLTDEEKRALARLRAKMV